MKIFKDVALSGVYTVTVTGSTNVTVRYGSTRVRGGQSEEVDFPLAQSQETLEVQAAAPGAAALTVSFTGTGTATNYTCSTYVNIKAWGVEFVHAEGSEEGGPMGDIPVFTPISGAGKGVPIYDCPEIDLALSLSPKHVDGLRSAAVTYLGDAYTLTEIAADSLVFTNGVMDLTLFGSLLADTNVLEWISASVSITALGITNSVYPCIENSADSSAFRNSVYGLIFSTTAMSGIPRVATLHIETDSVSDNTVLMETVAGSNIFTNGDMSVHLIQISGQPYLAISDGILLNNSVFSVWETAPQSGIYRNYNEPVPTDLPESALEVPDFAPWKLTVTGISDPSLITLAAVGTSIDHANQITFTAAGNALVSEQKFLLIPNRDLDAPVPTGYTPLQTDTQSSQWKTVIARTVSANVQLAMVDTPATKTKKRKEDAVVLQSLKMNFLESMATGLDPESKIRAPIQEMRYSAVPHYKASKAVALGEARGKLVWYSLSHGHLVTNLLNSKVSFGGLKFIDGEMIRAADLSGLDLGYKLVMIDGCCSAMTERLDKFCVVLGQVYNGPEKLAARNNNDLVEECMDFADAFGGDSAYVGWAWVMNPATAQGWMSEFLSNLKGGKTVQQAYNIFIENGTENNQPDVKLMKIYGSIDNVIDKTGVNSQ